MLCEANIYGMGLFAEMLVTLTTREYDLVHQILALFQRHFFQRIQLILKYL